MKFLIFISVWSVLFGCASSQKVEAKPVQVFEGTLVSGMMAIGGETTGIVLRMKNGEQVELELPQRIRAKDFRGKEVRVTGSLKEMTGTEIRNRKILQVSELTLLSSK